MSFSPENQEPRARRGAFTLIELLAVVAVIAILTALLIPVVSSMITRAQSSADLSNLRQLHHAYFLAAAEDNGMAPMAAVPEAISRLVNSPSISTMRPCLRKRL